MRERPILFSGPMVRALLAGTKTQTRRPVKLTDSGRVKAVGSNRNWHPEDSEAVSACPHGAVGDWLWVRETWATLPCFDHFKPSLLTSADAPFLYCAGSSVDVPIWRPSIFMPRFVSRITLEITAVRIERLNEINGQEAWAEGCPFHAATDPSRAAIINWFRDVWESSYGVGSWAANPMVWVIEFRKL